MDDALRTVIAQREHTLDRLRELLLARLSLQRSPAEIDPDTPLFGLGLGLDSIDAIELLVSVEAEFGVTLESAQAMRAMRTLGTLVDALLEKAA